MKILAVTGKPILHSKSPDIFNFYTQQKNIDAVYFRLAANSAEEAIGLLKLYQLRGLNVTSPFKEDMLSLADVIDSAAQQIGSINTIVNNNGILTGYNTDYLGIQRSLARYGVDCTAKNCLVLGAGGAARAVIYALKELGATVTVINRTFEKAKKLATEFAIQSASLDDLEVQLSEADIFISTLSADICMIDPNWLRPEMVVFDANYKSSTLQRIATKRECRVISGIDWLVNQAAPAAELFFETEIDTELMYEALQVKKLSKKNYNLSLVGLMGSGKSTTGNYIAENTNLKFEDTDIAIVKKYNKTVSEIFKTEGEKSFRDKETKTLDSLLKRPNTVIACGGGIVLKPENRDMLARRTCVIWLSASPQQVIARMKPGSRPLLQVEDPLAKAKELFVERAHLYASVADVMINAENYTTEQIASKIYEEIDTAFGN
ncbi:MAG: hypothetical protein RIS47_801 [Bacteroidota bacterium]|jgi:shikimate dehydrogenase